MNTRNLIAAIGYTIIIGGCGIPKYINTPEAPIIPNTFYSLKDSTNLNAIDWHIYFKDAKLIALIEMALQHNQELQIMKEEIKIANNEVKSRKGEYLPSVNLQAGLGLDKKSEYTLNGKLEKTLEIIDGKENPKPLGEVLTQLHFNWELDIWHKLRNAKNAAAMRYMASNEAKNFMTTQLIAEIASTYYELIALDNEKQIINDNIKIQTKALEVIRIQKQATRVTELAVKKFEAEVLKTNSLQFELNQKITITENKLNYLIGRFPTSIERDLSLAAPINNFDASIGIPVQLLENRPDILQANYLLLAANLDLKVAKANFYPSIGISGNVGLQAFNPAYWIKAPESILFNILGDLVAPVINKNAINAAYKTANAHQIQAVYTYQQTLINAYVEVANQYSKVLNTSQNVTLKEQQVAALNASIDIANNLFVATRADYMEILMTQRDALEAQLELIAAKKEILLNRLALYQALGGGWK